MPLAVLLNPDDPIYGFEHAMQTRNYFAVMERLYDFSVLPYLLDPVAHTAEPASSWNLRHQQSHNDFNTDLPSTYADGYTTAVVTPAAATGTGNSTGTTSVAISAVTGTIMIGAIIQPSGAKIVAQQSGPTGGAGTYSTDIATTFSNTALTITHPPYTQANELSGGTFGIPQAQILLEGNGGTPENRSWWTFVNHRQHLTANNAILPLPTTKPLTAGTPPGMEVVSNPWWWTERAPVNYPFW